jgi:hypothetical protein
MEDNTTHPELLQLGKMRQILNFLNEVVTDIKGCQVDLFE